MPIRDAKLDWTGASGQALGTGAGPILSTNVLDAESAKQLLGSQGSEPVEAAVVVSARSGTGTVTLRAEFVGADDAALTSNVVTLGDTGVRQVAAGEFVRVPLGAPVTTAKRYYGWRFYQGGTTPNHTVHIYHGPQLPTFRV